MKELQRELLRLVGEKVPDYSFQKKSTRQSFLKAIPEGRLSFHLAFIQHRQDFDVTADIAIRFDDLESLVNANSGLLTEKEKDSTYSLGIEIGNLIEGKQKRWTIASKEDVSETVNHLMDVFKRYALPYFEKYSSMENAFDLLSNNKQSNWIHCPIHAARAKRAIGLAILTGNKDKVLDLVRDNTIFLRKVSDSGLQDFMEFAEKLRES